MSCSWVSSISSWELSGFSPFPFSCFIFSFNSCLSHSSFSTVFCCWISAEPSSCCSWAGSLACSSCWGWLTIIVEPSCDCSASSANSVDPYSLIVSLAVPASSHSALATVGKYSIQVSNKTVAKIYLIVLTTVFINCFLVFITFLLLL